MRINAATAGALTLDTKTSCGIEIDPSVTENAADHRQIGGRLGFRETRTDVRRFPVLPRREVEPLPGFPGGMPGYAPNRHAGTRHPVCRVD
jgi:hypothetical protein